MSSLGKQIVQGMIGAYLQMGLEIDKIDYDNQTLYITIPKDSVDYHRGDVITDPASFAKRIKQTWTDLGVFPQCRCKYRIKDVYWTTEMGEKNYKDNFHKIQQLIMP